MAIKYTPDLNAEMRRNVRNFNKRRNRLEQQGYRNLPEIALVSELKKRYTKTSDLRKELTRLQAFNKDTLRKIETKGGAKAIKWQFDFVKNNLKNAREYFEEEYERVSEKAGIYPGERAYLDTIAAKLSILDEDINYMNQNQFRRVFNIVDEFASAPRMRVTQYRGFLSEVEWAMRKLGMSDEVINKFFKKFNKLTPSQFLYAYDHNPIIQRVYDLYLKTGEEAQFNTSDADAELLINILMEQADVIISEAKENMN